MGAPRRKMTAGFATGKGDRRRLRMSQKRAPRRARSSRRITARTHTSNMPRRRPTNPPGTTRHRRSPNPGFPAPSFYSLTGSGCSDSGWRGTRMYTLSNSSQIFGHGRAVPTVDRGAGGCTEMARVRTTNGNTTGATNAGTRRRTGACPTGVCRMGVRRTEEYDERGRIPPGACPTGVRQERGRYQRRCAEWRDDDRRNNIHKWDDGYPEQLTVGRPPMGRPPMGRPPMGRPPIGDDHRWDDHRMRTTTAGTTNSGTTQTGTRAS